MPEVGLEGQLKLKASSVLVVGAGGLGTPAATYLAAAGVGRIGVVDHDVVETSNLHRQVLFTESDVGKSKAEVLSARLELINPHIRAEPHNLKLNSSNALGIIGDYEIVIDGTDNFPTRYLINDACVLLGKPDVYASVFRFDGQASVFSGRSGPCYRCLYPEPPPPDTVPSCAEGGVLGVLPGVMGSIQAIQALNLLLGTGSPLVGRLLLFDAISMTFEEINIKKNPGCPACGTNPKIKELVDYDDFCGLRSASTKDGVTPEDLKKSIERGAKIIILDVREPSEHKICQIPGSILIPLGSLMERAKEFSRNADIVVYCHTGLRSERAVSFLRGLGFTRVKNLEGGIKAWAERVDPAMPMY
jgi:molybdopterin/thiamine biosynthesis adenylyltransferase/rhodanese-related sulfurtransferase